MTTLNRCSRRGLLAICCVGLAALSPAVFASPAKLSSKVSDLIERFFSPAEFENIKLSPTGSHVALFKETNGQLILATYNFKTEKLKLTSPAPGQKVGEFEWVGPNHLLFDFIQDKYKQDRPLDLDPRYDSLELANVYLGHWLADADLTHTDETPNLRMVYSVVDPLPLDPANALLSAQASDAQFGALYRYDPSRNKVKLVESNPGKVVSWHADLAGQVRLARVVEADGGFSYLYRDTEKSPWQPLPLPADSKFVAFDPSGQRLFISYRDESGRAVFQAYELAARKLVGPQAADPVYDVDAAALRDPRGGPPRGLTFQAEKSKFIWFDPQFKQLQEALSPALGGATVIPIGPTATGEILVHAFSDVSPSEYFLFNPKVSKLQLLFDRYPKVRDLTLSPMKPVLLQSGDGTDLHGYLTRPNGATGGRPAPLIALIHGGPLARDQWGYDPEVQYYAALGYAVLQLNYRGSAGYGRNFAQKDLAEIAQHAVEDLAAGLRWAVAQGIADPKRLVVCGSGYGSSLALGVAARFPELPAAVIGFATSFDRDPPARAQREVLGDFYKFDSNYHPELKKDAPNSHAVSPTLSADAVKAPVLLISGRNDRKSDLSQTEAFASALRKAGKSVETAKDAEGVHGLPDEKLRRNYYERVTAFLLQYAPPDLAP